MRAEGPLSGRVFCGLKLGSLWGLFPSSLSEFFFFFQKWKKVFIVFGGLKAPLFGVFNGGITERFTPKYGKKYPLYYGKIYPQIRALTNILVFDILRIYP